MISLANKYSFLLNSVLFSIAYWFLIIKTVLLVIPFLILFGILYGLLFYASIWSFRNYTGMDNLLRNMGIEIVGLLALYCLYPLVWLFNESKPTYLIFATFGVISSATFLTILILLNKLKYIFWSIVTFCAPVSVHMIITNFDVENWVPFLKFVIPSWIIFNGVFFQIFFLKLTNKDNSKGKSH